MNELTQTSKTRTLVPASSILEEKDHLIVQLEMPGVQKGDVEIGTEGKTLTIRGKRQQATESGTWLVRERRRGDFERVYTVDPSIDLEKASAELSNGVLTVTLPLKEAAKPRKIDIRSA